MLFVFREVVQCKGFQNSRTQLEKRGSGNQIIYLLVATFVQTAAVAERAVIWKMLAYGHAHCYRSVVILA